MRYLALALGSLLLVCIGAASAQTPGPPAGLSVVYAVTEPTKDPPVTSVYVLEANSGVRHLAYRDPEEGNRVLIKIAASDIEGTARAVPPRDAYFVMGPARADLNACTDALCRMRIGVSALLYDPEPLFPLPLCFSDASPYGWWNRAPIFAVSQDARRFAITALRAGETRFERPTIRVLSGTGEELWQIALDNRELYVADLAWSPDGRSLAYLVLVQGDVHTLEETLLPQAGLYLADTEARTTRFLHHCFAYALAWGPKPDQITVVAAVGDIWSPKHVARVLSLPSGGKVEEFSLRGYVRSLAYSDDKEWVAVQSTQDSKQRIWLYSGAGGWGRLLYELPSGEGRLALLGWARLGDSSR